MQTHLVSKIMHQNLAVILRQLNFSKISFIVLVPESRIEALKLMLHAQVSE